MKRVLITFIAVLSLTAVNAGDKKKAPPPPPKETKEIEWISFAEAEKRMKEEPRKVWIDVYTDWCGWCKVLDKKVFTNPEVIDYMNKKFYAIKFNAERQDSIEFMGKKWGFKPEYKANELAVQLMNGQMAYPTTILMTENFQSPTPVGGYHPVEEVEQFLKFLGEDTYKTTKWEDYSKNFKNEWHEVPSPTPVVPPHAN